MNGIKPEPKQFQSLDGFDIKPIKGNQKSTPETRGSVYLEDYYKKYSLVKLAGIVLSVLLLSVLGFFQAYAMLPPSDVMQFYYYTIQILPGEEFSQLIWVAVGEDDQDDGSAELVITHPDGVVTKTSKLIKNGAVFAWFELNENSTSGTYHVLVTFNDVKREGTFYVEVIEEPTPTADYDGIYDLKIISNDQTEKHVLISGITIKDGQISSEKFAVLEVGTSYYRNYFDGFVNSEGTVFLFGPCYDDEEDFLGDCYYSELNFDENKIATGHIDWSIDPADTSLDTSLGTWILSPSGGNIEGFTRIIPQYEKILEDKEVINILKELEIINQQPANLQIDPDEYPKIVGSYGKYYWPLKLVYFCADICPDLGYVTLIFADITSSEECKKIGGVYTEIDDIMFSIRKCSPDVTYEPKPETALLQYDQGNSIPVKGKFVNAISDTITVEVWNPLGERIVTDFLVTDENGEYKTTLETLGDQFNERGVYTLKAFFEEEQDSVKFEITDKQQSSGPVPILEVPEFGTFSILILTILILAIVISTRFSKTVKIIS